MTDPQRAPSGWVDTLTLGSSVRTAGQEGVPVVHRRSEPSVAMIDRPVGNWLPWGPTLALGLFLSLDAMRGWLARRRRSS